MSSGEAVFQADNMPVKLVAIRKISAMETAGISLKGYEENEEFVTHSWVARQLIDAGLARLAEQLVDISELSRIHYMERIHPVDRVAPLPERFYQRTYLTLSELTRSAKDRSGSDEARSRFVGMYRDILEGRIRKIVRLASLSANTDQTKSLTAEEKSLFEKLALETRIWRSEMLALAGED